MIKIFIWVSIFLFICISYPLVSFLDKFQQNFFKKQTFLFTLFYILMSIAYGITLILTYLGFWIFSSEFKKNKEINSTFNLKIVFFLALFKLSPFVQLFISFFGEFIAVKLHPTVILVFCSIYPLLMGFIQKLTSLVDEKYNLRLEMFAEAYSLFFASLPYKLVYLGLDSFWMGFMVLMIKAGFKTIVYIILPLVRNKKNRVGKVSEKKNLVISGFQTAQIKDKNAASLVQDEKCWGKMKKNLKKFLFEDQFQDRKLFALKFIVHELSDITQDIGVFSLVYTTNFIVPYFNKNISFKFPSQFVFQISIWTFVELLIDFFFFFFCLSMNKRFYFKDGVLIHSVFNGFLRQYWGTMILFVFMLFVLCFYIVYFVVIKL